MEEIERIQTRLNNIRLIAPILEALRTISIGGWQVALRRRERLHTYESRLQAILSALHPYLSPPPSAQPPPTRIVILVIGSERGLCGRFNHALVDTIAQHIHTLSDRQIELLALGTRLARLLHRRVREPDWSHPLSATTLPSFSIARTLTRRWIDAYEADHIDAVDVIYNAYRAPGLYTPKILRLLPLTPPPVTPEETWPPPIIETDPARILAQTIKQWITLRLYDILLESAASEHSARFQLMESATQNADKLIWELTQLVQAARKQAITREMQELAAGAGLIGPRDTAE